MYYNYILCNCVIHRYYKLSNFLLKDNRINHSLAIKMFCGTNKKMIESLISDIRTYPTIDMLDNMNRIDSDNIIKYLVNEIRILPSSIMELICVFPNKKMLKLLINDIRIYSSKDFLNNIEIELICTKNFGKYLLKYNKGDIDYGTDMLMIELNEDRDSLLILLKDIPINIPIKKIYFKDIHLMITQILKKIS